MRLVLDTNNLISGLLSGKGPPGSLLRLWLEGRFLLLTSLAQLNELRRVFEYPKIRERIHPEQADDFLNHVDALAEFAETSGTLHLSSDPDDNKILQIAVDGQADWIVSGDKTGLLDLKKVEGIPIITAKTALNRLTSQP